MTRMMLILMFCAGTATAAPHVTLFPTQDDPATEIPIVDRHNGRYGFMVVGLRGLEHTATGMNVEVWARKATGDGSAYGLFWINDLDSGTEYYRHRFNSSGHQTFFLPYDTEFQFRVQGTEYSLIELWLGNDWIASGWGYKNQPMDYTGYYTLSDPAAVSAVPGPLAFAGVLGIGMVGSMVRRGRA